MGTKFVGMWITSDVIGLSKTRFTSMLPSLNRLSMNRVPVVDVKLDEDILSYIGIMMGGSVTFEIVYKRQTDIIRRKASYTLSTKINATKAPPSDAAKLQWALVDEVKRIVEDNVNKAVLNELTSIRALHSNIISTFRQSDDMPETNMESNEKSYEVTSVIHLLVQPTDDETLYEFIDRNNTFTTMCHTIGSSVVSDLKTFLTDEWNQRRVYFHGMAARPSTEFVKIVNESGVRLLMGNPPPAGMWAFDVVTRNDIGVMRELAGADPTTEFKQ